MAFEVQDYLDLVRLLGEHPEWRAELRRLLLTDELLALPEMVRELIEAQRRTEEQVAALAVAQRRTEEAQRRTEERLSRTEEQLAALAEAQRRTEEALRALAEAQRRSEERLSQAEERLSRTEERLSRTEERLSRTEEQLAALAEAQRRTEERLSQTEEELRALAEAQRRTEEALRALAEAQRRTEERLTQLASETAQLREAQQRTEIRLGYLMGRALEAEYENKASAYFGTLLRQVCVVERETLRNALEAHLSPADVTDALLVDLIVSGQPRVRPEVSDVYLAIEVSAVVDVNDVKRAWRRARLLGQAGYRAIPVVAGERATPGAKTEARNTQVAVLQNGRVYLWEEALQAWLAE
ncbi:MAG: hypothetical protein RMM98_11540 [Acidobacteriota bacterium]|nr:hypothetical protein [Blastocatellia bacterium]MDW8240240.1 hypothetical protein [Acidobacteriota bacterium]